MLTGTHTVSSENRHGASPQQDPFQRGNLGHRCGFMKRTWPHRQRVSQIETQTDTSSDTQAACVCVCVYEGRVNYNSSPHHFLWVSATLFIYSRKREQRWKTTGQNGGSETMFILVEDVILIYCLRHMQTCMLQYELVMATKDINISWVLREYYTVRLGQYKNHLTGHSSSNQARQLSFSP